MALLLTLLNLTAGAAETTAAPPPFVTDHDTAVLVSPIGPVVSLVGTAMGTPTADATLRFHHMTSDRVGLTLQTDLTSSVPFDLTVSHASLRGGPRLSLRQRGLADWTLTPFAVVGITTIAAAHERLARYGVVGGGVEVGRTWVWRRFTMELGLGAYSVVPVGFAARAEVFAEDHPVNVLPIKPAVTWGLGYAF